MAPHDTTCGFEVVHRYRLESVTPRPFDLAIRAIPPGAGAAAIAVLEPPAALRREYDVFGNAIWRASFAEPVSALRIAVTWQAAALRLAIPLPTEKTPDAPWPEQRSSWTHPNAAVLAFARSVPMPEGHRWVPRAAAVVAAVRATLRFDPNMGAASVPAAAVLARRCGVCRDFAHLGVAALGALGFDARYVGGVLIREDPRLPTGCRGEHHAWLAVRGDDGRWVGLDPTPLGDDVRRVALAWGRDEEDTRVVGCSPPLDPADWREARLFVSPC